MSTREEVNKIEDRIRLVFNKDRITKIEVNECNRLLERWKELTNYVPIEEPIEEIIEEPIIMHSILDEEPDWITKKQKQ